MIYIVSLALLSFRDIGFDQSSRGLILAISIGRFLLSLLIGIMGKKFLALAGEGAYLKNFYSSFELTEATNVFFACLAFTIWKVFVPLCVLRWWACGRFARPTLVAFLLALFVFSLLTIAPASEEHLPRDLALIQALVYIVVNALLFRPSPCNQPLAEARG